MTRSVVLFSGGLDSVVASVKEAITRDSVLLLTVDNGALFDKHLVKISFKQLKNKYSNIEALVLADGKYLFKRYVIETLEEDILKYRYNLVCLGCKLVMYTIAIAHALNTNAQYIVDGSSSRQSTFPEQRKEIIKWFDHYVQSYGLTLTHPVYEVKTKEEIKYLAIKYQLPPKPIEPTCLFGNSFKDDIPVDVMISYLEDKVPLVERELDSMIKERWYISKIYHS